MELDSDSELQPEGKLVHFSSPDLQPDEALTDPNFGFTVAGAVRMRWTPEYCQWDEASMPLQQM